MVGGGQCLVDIEGIVLALAEEHSQGDTGFLVKQKRWSSSFSPSLNKHKIQLKAVSQKGQFGGFSKSEKDSINKKVTYLRCSRTFQNVRSKP